MSGVKLYRREDQDFCFKGASSVNGYVPASYLAFANAGYSVAMGGGLAVFGAGKKITFVSYLRHDDKEFVYFEAATTIGSQAHLAIRSDMTE